MPRYLIERTMPNRWHVGTDIDDGCRQIIERNGDDVTWLHSYLSEDGRKSFCVYEAPSPEALRKSAARNNLPVDSITSIRVLDPYSYTHAKEDQCAQSRDFRPAGDPAASGSSRP
jgi:hypothetical protein